MVLSLVLARELDRTPNRIIHTLPQVCSCSTSGRCPLYLLAGVVASGTQRAHRTRHIRAGAMRLYVWTSQMLLDVPNGFCVWSGAVLPCST